MSDEKTLKQAFSEALETTPLAPFLDRKIASGSIEIPSEVSDALSAQKACGIFARNMSLYLQAWEDIPLLYVALYTGNNVQALQGLLLSNLKLVKPATIHAITPFRPIEGQSFAINEAIAFAADISGIDDCRSVSVTVSGPASATIILEPVGGFRYAAKDTLEFQVAGAYVATFSAYFRKDYVDEQAINFEVA